MDSLLGHRYSAWTIINKDHQCKYKEARLNGVQKTQFTARWIVKGGLPLGKRLQSIHHTAVVPICRGSDETKEMTFSRGVTEQTNKRTGA